MTRSAAFFLILLRLAIGWHFLMQGYLKIPAKHLDRLGLPILQQQATKKWTSDGYFSNAGGPFAHGIRALKGDPDDEALARLEVAPIAGDAKAAPAEVRVPRGTKKEWVEYLQHFRAFYDLDQAQRDQADSVLEKAEAKLVALLTYVPDPDPSKRDKLYDEMTTEQTTVYPSGEFKRRMTLAERVAEYKAKVAALRQIPDKLWTFGKDVEGFNKVQEAKAEVKRLRDGLLKELDGQTKAYHEALGKLLTPEQKARGELVLEKPRTIVDSIDSITPWMLTGLGVCLLIGLFSRLAAFLAAGFLLLTYLATPALLWLSVPPSTEGVDLIVNKNLIEMLALLVLACVPSGRWFGADGLLYALTGPFRRKPTES